MNDCIILHDAKTGSEIQLTRKAISDSIVSRRSDGYTSLIILERGMFNDIEWNIHIVKETKEEIIKMVEDDENA